MSSIVVAGDTSGSITLQAPGVAGSAVLTLPAVSGTVVATDSAGNVGIGTSSPASKLHVEGNLTLCGYGAVQASNSTTGISILGGNQPNGINSGGQINLRGTVENRIEFLTSNNEERMRIDGSGNVTLQKNISVGGAAPTTSGTGITFPATQSASTNANTLDDYEEGTYTPTITFNTTNGNLTYSIQVGRYIKIGQTVYVGGIIVFAQTTASSYFWLNNLPFTSKNVTNFFPSTGCGVTNMNGLSGGVYLQVQPNAVTAYPYITQTGTTTIIGTARCNGGSAEISWGFTYLSDV